MNYFNLTTARKFSNRTGFFSLLFSLFLIFPSKGQPASYTLQSRDLTINTNGVITACSYNFANKRIIIPTNIDGTDITGIASKASYEKGVFEDSGLISVSFPADSKVTSIGTYAFRNNNLTSVTFGEGSNLEYIRFQAFADNPNLAPIKFPSHARNDFEDYRDGNENHYNPGDTFSDFSLAYFAYIPYELTANELIVDVNGIITDCNCDNLPSKTIIIPTNIDGKDITGIADGNYNDGVFEDKGLISVSFPADSKVTSIGDYAFWGNNLTSVDFPAGLTTIGRYAFRSNNLTSVDFPAGLTTIGRYAFRSNNLTSVDFPAGLTTIGRYAFQFNNLTSVDFPASLTTIGESAFSYNNLTSVDFPAGLTTIGDRAFNGNNLTFVDFPAGLITIGAWAFKDNNLTSVDFPAGLTTIGGGAFYDNDLISLDFPASLTTIGDWAFESNDLISLDFPASLTTIGAFAFESNDLTSLDFPAGLTTIGESAFKDNSLTSPLDFPASLTTIGGLAFVNNSLTSVTFDEGSNLEYIRFQAFADNPNLAPIKFPSHARNDFEGYRDGNENHYNPGDTFSDFSLAYFAYLPYVTTNQFAVDDNGVIIYCNCDNLPSKTIIIPTSIDGKEITGIADEYYYDDGIFEEKGIISVSFSADSKVTFIGESAFEDNNLASVDFPAGLTTIGGLAFSGNNLASVDFPAGLTTIGGGAFAVNNLTSVDFPAGLTTIGGWAFQSNNLTSVDFPAGLTTIGDGAFWNNNLTSVDFPAGLTSIEYETFTGNNLTSLDFPASLTTIEASAFAVNNLTSVSFPEDSDIQTIEYEAFTDNQNLTSITLPLKQEEGRRYYWTDYLTDEIDPVITDFDLSYHRRSIEQIKLTLKIGILENGTFTEGDFGAVEGLQSGDNWIDKGVAFDLVASANAGYRFVEWEIDGMDMKVPTNPYSLPATQTDSDVNVTAYFVEQVTLTVSINGNMGGDATTSKEPNSGNHYDKGTVLDLIATASDDYRFDKWIINGQTIVASTTTVVMDENKSATAYFVEQVTLTVSVYDDIGGSVSPPDGVFTIDKVNPVPTKTLTATASDSYRFDKWIIAGQTIATPTTTVDMDVSKSATAYFVEQITLTVSVYDDIGGSVSPPDGVFTIDKVNPAPTKTLTATAREGYRFDKWVIHGQTIVASTTTVDMDVSKSATAYFVEQVTLTVSINGNMGGDATTSKEPNSGNHYDKGTVLDLIATASDDYRFDKWIINGQTIVASTTTVVMDENKSATAYFVEQVTLTVSVYDDIGGSVSPPDGVFTIDKVNPVPTKTLTATASDSYRFDKWIIAGQTIATPTTTVDMDVSKSATAYFVEQITLTVSVYDDIGGSVSPPDGVFTIDKVNPAPTKTLTATAREGYRFDKWVIHGQTIVASTTTVDMDVSKSATAYFVEQVTLTVSINGNMGGDATTSKEPNSGNHYDKGTVLDLIATASDDYRFDKWIINGQTIVASTTTVVMDENKSATAYFVEQVTLTVSVYDDIGGSVSPPDGVFTIDKVNPVPTKTLTATASDSYRFDKWIIAGQTIATPTTTVDMDVSKSATAYFVEQITLTVSVYDDIGGSVSPPDGVFTIDKVNPAPTKTLTATAREGYRFDKWVIHGQTIVASTTTVDMDVSKSATAYFVEQVTLTVSINGNMGGDATTSKEPNSGNHYDKGTVLDLIATASDDYRFDKWIINGQTIVASTTTVVMDENKSATAYFVEQVTLTVSVYDDIGGSVSPPDGVFTIDKVNSVPTKTLTATASDSYRFDKWIIAGQTIATPTTTVDMDVSKSATAYFVEQITLTVSVYDDIGGSVSPPDGVFTVDKDNPAPTKTLTATAREGYRFDKWVIAGQTIATPTTTVDMDVSKSATAYFVEQITLTVSVYDDIGGSVSPPDGVFTVDKDNPAPTKTLTATAREGYRFDKWVIHGQTIVASTTTVDMDVSKSATAYFVEQVTLTVSINGNMGGDATTSKEPNSGNHYDKGTVLDLIATASDDYRFDKWIINGQTIVASTTTVVMDENKSATAYFVEQVTLTVSVYDDIGGSVSPPDGVFTIDKVNPVPTKTLTATASDSYRFDKWIINGQTIVASTTTVDMDVSKSATAYFVEQITLTVSVYDDIGGSVSPPDGVFTVDKDNPAPTKTLTATAREGYRFDKWVIHGQTIVASTTTVDMDVSKSATAYFVEQVTLTVSINGNMGGNISPRTGTFTVDKVNLASTQQLVAIASDSYRFDKWIINELTVVDSTTTITMDGNKLATAYFVEQVEQVTLTVSIDGNMGGNISPREGIFTVDKVNPASTQQLVATASEGYRFDKWIINGQTVVDSTTTITMDGNKSATAYFVEQVTLTVSIDGNMGGNILPREGTFTVDKDNPASTQQLTATAGDSYRFDKWIINELTVVDSTTTIIMDVNKSATAYFVEVESSISKPPNHHKPLVPFYPNPAFKVLTVAIAEVGDRIELLSELGALVHSSERTAGSLHQIDVEALPSGVYLLQITDSQSETLSYKVVKISTK